MLGGESARAEKISDNEEVLKGNYSINSKSTQRKKEKKSGRRFSEEQIKSLESVFEMENRVEPKKKLEMARELGLHPRQVAIWFQNRRARWKSKQVEHHYSALKSDYDHLTLRFHSLTQEKHHLLQQLKNLCSKLKEGSQLDTGGNNTDMSGSSGDQNVNVDFIGPSQQHMYSDQDDHTKLCSNYISDDQGLFDQPSSNWWDIWA